ncbi:MAG: deoxyribodipyrimidine photo-lyase [Rhodocyclaceae bacterium]|nr:deoxyribodipyrimidine photo-lyase [Rhodocyclaceae bacterium]
MTVVWFKRDLRVSDHAPLAAAALRGPVLPIYVIEPEVFAAPDFAHQHWGFIRESLHELQADLATLGSPLAVYHGEITHILSQLKAALGTFVLASHEETGNDVTFQRDLRVKRWCANAGITWREYRQHGVVRGLRIRDQWASRWDQHMRQLLIPEPESVTPPPPFATLTEQVSDLDQLALSFRQPDKPHRQRGGRAAGVDLLISFLEGRGQHYRRAMSSPLSAADECSRLSPHFAYGTVSIREAAHALWARRSALLAMPAEERPPEMLASLKSFESRLHWHCHFMQKLESEPAIEFRNVHRGFDGVRNENAMTDEERAKFRAWARGETGYPMIDACMKMLHATGWINFRMRAMLVSFASYQLWLHWRHTSVYLATQFLDYEPGIHYPQVQMQSGVTGINTIRIYNPVKQAQDQDPDGVFVRRWLPVLAKVPDEYIFEPWTMPPSVQDDCGVVIGRDYPAPIVDHLAAAAFARETLWALRKGDGVRAEAQRVYQKHGSRNPAREGMPKRRKGEAESKVPAQISLDFEAG